MRSIALQPDSAWAEDRALLRSNPNAVPGAKTDGAARGRPVLHHPHRDWHQSDKPSQQDAATSSARCPSQLVNANRSTFQFPLNQDSLACELLTEGVLRFECRVMQSRADLRFCRVPKLLELATRQAKTLRFLQCRVVQSFDGKIGGLGQLCGRYRKSQT